MNRRRLLELAGMTPIVLVPGWVQPTRACEGEGHTHRVTIESFVFSPSDLVVEAGDTIVFVNKDIAPHTATDTEKRWDSGSMALDQSWTLAVTNETIGSYYCQFHPNMKATLTLKSPG